MLKHVEQKNLPFTPQQMFELVAAVELYRDFLPWCVASRINRRESDEVFYADLVVGYKMFRETFSSKVYLEKPDLIHIEYVSGPLKSLSNHWRFIEEADGSCTIDFSVEFSFKNKAFQMLIEGFFEQVVKRMVAAFEAQAHDLYEPLFSQSGSQS